ncbi:MAG: PA2928 family protein [Rhodanobacteraceae bacterium]
MKRWISRSAALACVVALAAFLCACNHSTFRPPGREGPPGLVKHGDEAHLWLMTKQEEQRMRHLGGGTRSIGKWITETWYHFDLQAHDPATTARVWKKRLLTVKDDQGGHSAQSRIFGQDGNKVWLFVNDQPVAVAAADGSVLADRKTLEQANPELRDLIPNDLDFYAYDDGLVIVAADARQWRIRGADYKAEPYTAPNDDYFRNVQFMATRWNGGFHTDDFLVRQANVDGKWIGLYSEKEAKDVANDEFGDHYKGEVVFNEGSQARRTFWTARIGKTKEFSEGTHDRLFDVTRVPGAPEYLQVGMLVRQGTRQPLRLQDPSGFLVLHRTRLDEQGRLAITRLDDSLKPQWTTKLPYHDLRNRFESKDHLLLYGLVQETVKGVTSTSEHIVSLDLRDGKVRAWNVPLEREVGVEEPR